jgi:ubiquinone/menaquinone biosynthesis C-methylase UbiE
MDSFERILIQQGYSNRQGFFTRSTAEDYSESEPEKVWSKLAQDNPIHAAAATNITDWYAKYPRLVDQEIPDEEKIVLDAGCGYGRVAIPLLQARRKLRLIGVDASTVMLSKFVDLLETESIEDIDERLLLLHSRINQLPFSNDTVDFIYSCAVLLHNPYKDVEDILNEFYRLLKPTGKLILAGSFPNVMNLEGIQNFLYSTCITSAQANGPVRAYTKCKVRSLFNKWREVRILSTGVTVLPRQIARISMPWRAHVKRFNQWIDGKNVSFISQSSLFAKHLDVVARK